MFSSGTTTIGKKSFLNHGIEARSLLYQSTAPISAHISWKRTIFGFEVTVVHFVGSLNQWRAAKGSQDQA